MRLPLPVARKLCKRRSPIWKLVVERTEMQGKRQMFAKLTELLCRKSSQCDDLNSVTVHHLRSLYIFLEAKNCCSSDQRDAHENHYQKGQGSRCHMGG
ncbi:hypothetical protein MRX96_007627 [Rhipicephalus microplus]